MITQTVSSLLQDSVTLEIDCIDRLYLNAYQPMLQTGGGVSCFFRQHRGAQVASSVLMAPMSADFVKSINRFAREEGLDIERFQKGVRKDEVTQARLADFRKDVIIEMYNEAGQLAIAYQVFRCWVSEYQALPELDASANAVGAAGIGVGPRRGGATKSVSR